MRVFGLISAAAFALLSAAAYADGSSDPSNAMSPASNGPAGQFEVRLRADAVIPDSSANILSGGKSIGGVTKVSNSLIPEADLTYFITNNISVEAIAAITKHTVYNSVVGDVSNVWLLPPTVTAQYQFDPEGPIRPYVGAGINYTFFYDHNSTLPSVGFKNNFGWALQTGADVPIGDGPYFLNADVKKIFLGTHIQAAGGTVQASARLNPWIIGTGVGLRF